MPSEEAASAAFAVCPGQFISHDLAEMGISSARTIYTPSRRYKFRRTVPCIEHERFRRGIQSYLNFLSKRDRLNSNKSYQQSVLWPVGG